MRIILAVLAVYHALAIPLRYIFAWLLPAKPVALGVMPLAKLPEATVLTAILFSIIQVILLLNAFWQLWIVLSRFENGRFFSKEIVQRIRRVGWFLLIVAPVQFAGVLIGIATFSLSHRHIMWSAITSHAVANIPTGLLICGLLALLVAAAFDQAVKMQHEARLTI
ncbi:DUF2975 domain-containing protein [Sphingobium sp. CAP-1]|uniref:DUF2975 domain-containing protein n=1 Tax=Sphingobium sp. CAP-1 TaxID=2676077 RepID=UPI0018AD1C89|nr:DUF2975 domain-containing protein [Sphingobium sp. CAP-1]